MNTSFIKDLICPFCGSGLGLDEVYEADQEEVFYGVVRCSCSLFPIINGILVLRESSISDRVIQKLKQGRMQEAVVVLTGSDFLARIGRFLKFEQNKLFNWFRTTYERRQSRNFSAKISRNDFIRTIRTLKWGIWGEYVINRFVSDSYIGALPILAIIAEDTERLLDIACGLGHLSYYIRIKNPKCQITCLDRNFISLFLSQIFFDLKANHINLELNFPLPFKKEYFSSVICSDALHYFYSKRLFAQEVNRILKKDGISGLIHLHNARVHTGKGKPLKAEEYTVLFEEDGWHMNLLPEKELIRNMLWRNCISFPSLFPLEDIRNSLNISLILAKDKNWLKKNIKPDDIVFLSNQTSLMFNPLYQVQNNNSKHIYLKRKKLSPHYKKENINTFDYFPERLELNRNDLNDTAKIFELLKKFIVIQVPKRYVGPNSPYRIN